MASELNNASFHAMGKERYELFKSQDVENGLFDVTFIIDQKSVKAHKFILGSVSQVFKEMFMLRMRLKNVDPISIDDCSFDDFHNFLTFIYSGTCNLNDANMFFMAEMSERYRIEALQLRCTQYLTNAEYASDNFVQFFERFIEHPTFRRSFRTGMMKKYPKWLNSSNFLKAKKETIKRIVGLCRPYKHESKLFEAVYEWAKNRAKAIQEASTPRFVKFENDDDDCMIIDEIVPAKTAQVTDNALNELITSELIEILPKIYFNAMENAFVTSFVVQRGFLFTYPQLSKILNNIKKFEVEVTDYQGKKARGTLTDQNFIVDEIKKLENVRSNGYSWEISSKFMRSNLQFTGADTESSANVYYLKIRRNSSDISIAKDLHRDYFLAKMIAQKDFINKNCVIRLV